MNSYDSGMSVHLAWPVACLCCLVVLAGIGVGVYFAVKASQRRNG